jgi:enoyl-CoA hydratase/carnithine racemase
MDQPLVLQQRDERRVVTLTLNRPQSLNALSEAMLAALGERSSRLPRTSRCVPS